MTPKIPSIDKLNTYWFKMKPAASRAPSFKAMGLLLECLNSRYKLVKTPGRYERSIPVLKLRTSKQRPRKRKTVDPKNTEGTYNLEKNPSKHKEKDNISDDIHDHDHGHDYRSEEDNDQPPGDERVGDKPAGYARQHIRVEKNNNRSGEPQRKKLKRDKSKKKRDQPSTDRSRESPPTMSMSPIKDQRDQESPKVVKQNEENLSAEISSHRVKQVRGWSIVLQAALLIAPTLSKPCTRDEIETIYLEKSDSLKEKGEECLTFIEVFEHFVNEEKQHNDLIYIREIDNKIIAAEPRGRGGMNTTPAYVKEFPKLYHEIIDKVHDVVDDGNCGFRAIAKALNMPNGEDDWPLVRDQMLNEMNAHEELYRKVMVAFKNFEEVQTALTHENGSALEDKWMDFPDMGLLAATTFNVALLVLSKYPSTYLPLRQAPPEEKKIICIAHVTRRRHFVAISLKSEPPLPPVDFLWGPNKYPEAQEWEIRLKSNFELYAKKILNP